MKYPANEFWGNVEPICPYCKQTYGVEDWCSSHDSEDIEVECGSCSKKFMVQPYVRIQYSTVGDCALNGELPHEFISSGRAGGPFTCRKCKGEAYDWEFPGGQYPHFTENEFVIIKKSEETK